MIIFQFRISNMSREQMEKKKNDIEEQLKTHPHFVVLPAEIMVNYYPETGPADVIIRKER